MEVGDRLEVGDVVLVDTLDDYGGMIGIVTELMDKTSYNVGVEIDGLSGMRWFSESDLIKQ